MFIVFHSLQSWVSHLQQAAVLHYVHLIQYVRDRVAGVGDNLANEWTEDAKRDEKKRNKKKRSRA